MKLQATYLKSIPVMSRNVVQHIFETDMAGQHHALQVLGGMCSPPGESKWFDISPLDGSQKAQSPDPVEPAPMPPDRVRRPVAPDKRLAQQAGMMCNDPLFWSFLIDCEMLKYGSSPTLADDAATAVRLICGVKSRSEIVWGTPAGDAWDELHSKFVAWKFAPDTAA